MKSMGIVFSNIYDDALRELTGVRTVASLPFGGRYRQIDFVLSNLSHSGIYNIGLITKYNYRSLMDHLGSCAEWDLNRKNEGLVFLPPFASGNMSGVYKGKLEALYSAKSFLNKPGYDYVVICDSTVLCNIDYRPAIEQHVRSGVDVTVITTPANERDGRSMPLLMKSARNGRVSELLVDAPGKKGYQAGMGMFIIRRDVLIQEIDGAYSKGYTHLERDLIQRKFNAGEWTVGSYLFRGVVLRNQDISSYYENNMALLKEEVRRGLFQPDRAIFTKVRDETPTYYAKGSRVADCILADGCTVRGEVEESVLFRGVEIQEGASVKRCILMQGTKVCRGAKLECVILDKDVTITPNTVLKGTPKHTVIIQKGETV